MTVKLQIQHHVIAFHRHCDGLGDVRWGRGGAPEAASTPSCARTAENRRGGGEMDRGRVAADATMSALCGQVLPHQPGALPLPPVGCSKVELQSPALGGT